MKKLTKEAHKAKKAEEAKVAAERHCKNEVGNVVCGHNRFKTVEKKDGVLLQVACRKCGAEREVRKAA